MRILIYEGCEFIQKAMTEVLANHDLTVVNEVVTKNGSDQLFAIDAFSNQEIAIDATQFDLAFLDRQQDKNGEHLQLVTALSVAGLPCIGTSVMPKSNERIMTVAKFAMAKVVIVAALRSGIATAEDFAHLNSEAIAELTDFEQALLHQTSPGMVKLHQDTENFLKAQLQVLLNG